MAREKKFCDTCNKNLELKNYYVDKEGEPMSTCKKCIALGINPHKPETAFPILKQIDLPYIPGEWLILVNRYSPDPQNPQNPQTILGRYIAKMRLSQFKGHTWADTDRFVQEHRELLEKEEIKRQEENQKYKEALIEQGRTEEEAIQIMKEQEEEEGFKDFDFGTMLTKNERIAMTIKWGKAYEEEDWIKMEKMYQEMEESYDISTASHRDYLIKICKTSLKMDKAMDIDDIDGFTKLSKTYDTLMKSAKFQPSQSKEKDDGGMAICEMFAIAEKEKGIIDKYTGWVDAPLDIIDITVRDMQKYVENLVKNELNLGSQIESAIKLMELQMAEDKSLDDLAEDEFEVEDTMTLENYEDFSQLLDEESVL